MTLPPKPEALPVVYGAGISALPADAIREEPARPR